MKLAYLIDSSSAPVVVLIPLASWGATIMGIMAPVFAASALMLTQLEVFMLSAVMNYYAIAALLLLWLTILWGIDFGGMRREELRAVQGNGLHAATDDVLAKLTNEVPIHTKVPSAPSSGRSSCSLSASSSGCMFSVASSGRELGTGGYLASVVDALAMPAVWLVPALFVVAALIAFATGTSWGSFGILLPPAGELMNAVSGGDAFLIAWFGAVLAGAVWGDHSSLISDTTILSSTGAAYSIPTHVTTQLPYAFVGALAALIGYVVYALTQSGVIGLVVTLGLVVAIAAVIRKARPPIQEQGIAAVKTAEA